MSRAHIPRRVRVAGHDLRVELVATPRGDHDERLDGSMELARNLIQLDKALEDSQRLETLLHEAFHAVCRIYDLELREGEERVVQCFANAVFQLLRDNKRLVASIQGA